MRKLLYLGLVLSFCFSSLTTDVMARGGGANPPSAAEAVQAKVNVNTASSEELQAVKGIGPMLAERIIAYRSESGKFQQLEDVVKVRGIGQAKFEKIKDQITL